MGQGTKCDIILQVGWSWAPLTTVWKFVVMKKPTSAIQEFLKSGSNEVYHNPERLQRISGNLTWKYGTQIDFKLLTWWMFVRIWRCSLLEGRVGTDIRETLNILLCADCSMFLCIFRRFLALFWHIFTFRVSFASGADGEVACHRQEHLMPCVMQLSSNTTAQTLSINEHLENVHTLFLSSCGHL